MLWSHQQQMLEFALQKKQAIWWAWMGTGKTLTALNLISQVGQGKALVVVQPSGLEIWPDEAKKWGFDLPVVALNESSTQKRTQTVRRLRDEKFYGVVVVPYTGYWREPLYKELRLWGARTVIYDEAHNLKSAGAKQSRKAHTWYRDFDYRIGMTGTLIPNGPHEIYGTARAINPNLFGTNKEKFLTKYFIRDYTGYKIVGRLNEDEFNSRMASMVLEIKRGVLQIPSGREAVRHVTLAERTMDAYKSLLEHMIAETEEGIITASNVLVRTVRLQELASGVLTRDSDGRRSLLDPAKIEAAADWVSENEEPVIIWTRFQFELDRLRETLQSRGVSVYDGREKDLKSWKDGKTQVLLINLQAGSEGVDLTRSARSLYFGPSYSYKDYIQSKARIDRHGQTLPTLHTFLLSRNTIEEDIFDAVHNKHNMSEALKEILRNAQKSL